ncbi:hypothetical protein AN639_02295 [Candidatus Epulonipiscium fishelsonii]|uniref:Uncharacterized protein n=1 Tax=Candidatus Epulonipiscium fishelsonii TaxID=77094 RepID=A0ACC8XHF8_9FIRM|nr:hypothetical protein AN639_02295 [Epulopiscium sp. SCG-B05WGA-EpuloA1]ONI43003.1 hypothetical protein AN396_00130 [Epulopiscium sp. SCG-B11WGA-EpuloA1]
MKKDVLILCQFFYPEYVSTAVLPYEMAQRFVKKGLSVDVICGYPKEFNLTNKAPTKEIKNGIDISRLKYIQLKRNKKVSALINFISFMAVMSLKVPRYKNYKNIIVFTNPPVLPLLPIMAKKIFKFNLIYVTYDIYPELPLAVGVIKKGDILDSGMQLISNIIYKNITHIVALSDEMKQLIVTNKKVPPEKVTIIPNWYTDNPSLKTNVKNKHFQNVRNTYKTIVVYGGNMARGQDLQTLMDCAKYLKDESSIYFVLVGHGYKLKNLEDQAKDYTLKNIEFHDAPNKEDFQDGLKIADVCIVSMEKGVEGISVPSKTYHYMAIGKPIIAVMGKHTDIAKEVKENDIGYVVEQGDYKQLAKCILELDKDRDLIKDMSIRCRDLYERKYTSKICIDKYIKLIKSLDKRRK